METKHLYPNLEYIRSTAAHPRESHLEYVGTVLPIEHPWWDTHMPPSDWGCSCSVRPTDKKVTAVPAGELVPPVFQNNPGKSAEFVKLKEHPYVKKVCPDFNGCQNEDTALRLSDDKPACSKICDFVRAYIRNQKRIKQNKLEYEGLKKDKNYYDVAFNPKNGGLKAIHVEHNFDPKTGIYEKKAQNVGYKSLLSDKTFFDWIKKGLFPFVGFSPLWLFL